MCCWLLLVSWRCLIVLIQNIWTGFLCKKNSVCDHSFSQGYNRQTRWTLYQQYSTLSRIPNTRYLQSKVTIVCTRNLKKQKDSWRKMFNMYLLLQTLQTTNHTRLKCETNKHCLTEHNSDYYNLSQKFWCLVFSSLLLFHTIVTIYMPT